MDVNAKYQIFISSTFTDLEAERRSVMEQILNMGHIPVGMELFQASNDTQWDYIKRRIESSDYFIVIVAERYGSLDTEGKSFTRKEYEYALESKVPIAAFVISDQARRNLPVKNVEANRKTEIEDFRALVGKKLYKSWSDANDLKTQVGTTLAELIRDNPRPGWIRSNSIMFKNLIGDESFSREASTLLMSAVDRDLGATGYFRTGQVINFKVDTSKDNVTVRLHFHSKIVPVRSPARVYRPEVSPPAGAKLAEIRYSIGDAEVSRWRDVDQPTDDNLFVTYELTDRKASVTDLHFWPSPVLNYCIRFENSGPFEFKVGKIIGGADTDEMPGSKNGADQLEFTSKSAAFTAQGIKWTLSPTSA